MSNIVYCSHCGAPRQESESEAGKGTQIRAISMPEANHKIEQLKQALQRSMATKDKYQVTINELKAEPDELRSAK